jgi:hypothetical protein
LANSFTGLGTFQQLSEGSLSPRRDFGILVATGRKQRRNHLGSVVAENLEPAHLQGGQDPALGRLTGYPPLFANKFSQGEMTCLLPHAAHSINSSLILERPQRLSGRGLECTVTPPLAPSLSDQANSFGRTVCC